MKQMKALFTIAVTTLLILSCKAQAQPIATATTKPTSTLRPTQTATPFPSWVTDFAEPILKAIENQTPRFQDDFSNTNQQWSVGKQSKDFGPATPLPTPDLGTHVFGETGYVDGEYFTTADPNSCVGGTSPKVGAYQDFVAEFDARFASGMAGDWELLFRNNHGVYALDMNINSTFITFQKCISGTCEDVARYSDNQVKRGKEWNHMILIARSARVAVYANGIPLLYAEDKHFSEEFKMGTFSLSVCSVGDVPMEIRWDNLKLWDISNLP